MNQIIVRTWSPIQKVFYYLHFYYRTELREDSRKVIAEILKTAKWNA